MNVCPLMVFRHLLPQVPLIWHTSQSNVTIKTSPFRENQEILEQISQSKAIDTDPVNDDELLQMDSSVNTDDTDLRAIFIATGLFDRPENVESETDLSMSRKQRVQDDYDVDDLLKDVIIS